MNLIQLQDVVRNCTKCPLHATRCNAVVGEGDFHARLMFIGHAPGEEEDRNGRMFIGPSGQLFNELLKKAGIMKHQIYITNLVKCFLPNYRRPKMSEIMMCSQYLENEITLVDPKVIVALGYYPSKYLLESRGIAKPSRKQIRAMYGQRYEALGRVILPMHNPAAIIHNQAVRDTIISEFIHLRNHTDK